MSRKVKKYCEVQVRLRMNGFTNKDVGECMQRSADYVARHFRMDAGKSFDLEEAYRILDLAGLPKSDIFKYFPPGGEEITSPKLLERREVAI